MKSKDALEYLCKNCNHECCPYIQYDKSHCGFYGLIRHDLDRLEEINNVWHKNEVMESVDINGNHLQEVYDFIHNLLEESTKFKKVIDILKEVLKRVFIFILVENIDNGGYISITKIDCNKTTIVNIRKEEYELLKEVFGND